MAEASARVRLLPADVISMWRNTRFSTLRRAISMRASFSWMSWNSRDGPLPQQAVLGVLDRELEALLNEAERHGGHAGPLGDEVALGALAALAARRVALGLAEQPVLADPHVGEEELAGRRGVQAHLAEGLGLLEPGHAPVEDEGEHLALAQRRVAAVVELGVEDDGVGVGAVGDERLVAVEDVLVAVAHGRSTSCRRGRRSPSRAR